MKRSSLFAYRVESNDASTIQPSKDTVVMTIQNQMSDDGDEDDDIVECHPKDTGSAKLEFNVVKADERGRTMDSSFVNDVVDLD